MDCRPPEDRRNDFSGEARDFVQAHSVSGGVHFHGANGSRGPAPRQLPSDVPGFVNREDELDHRWQLAVALDHLASTLEASEAESASSGEETASSSGRCCTPGGGSGTARQIPRPARPPDARAARQCELTNPVSCPGRGSGSTARAATAVAVEGGRGSGGRHDVPRRPAPGSSVGPTGRPDGLYTLWSAAITRRFPGRQ